MPPCSVSIEIDQPDRELTFDETIRGHVNVAVEQDCHCNALRVGLAWKAHGHSREDEGLRLDRALYEGPWRAHESHRLPFSLDIPAGPVTFRGEHFSVDWYVTASADIASARDVHAEKMVVVRPGEDPKRVLLPTGRAPTQSARYGVAKAILQTVGGLVIGGPGWFILALGIVGVLAGRGAAWMGVAVGAVFALVGTPLLIQGVRSLIGTSLLKVIHLSLDPPACSVGQEVRLDFMFTPRQSLRIKGISATLRGEERAVTRTRPPVTYERTISTETFQMGVPPEGNLGLPISASAKFTAPSDAPYSFRLSSARHYWGIEWIVNVKVAIDGRPDWTRDLTLTIGP